MVRGFYIYVNPEINFWEIEWNLWARALPGEREKKVSGYGRSIGQAEGWAQRPYDPPAAAGEWVPL